jgi:hypothetical protein
MRQLAMAAAKAASVVLHGRKSGHDAALFQKSISFLKPPSFRTSHISFCSRVQVYAMVMKGGFGIPVSVWRYVFSKDAQPSKSPIEQPRPRGVSDDKARRKSAQGSVQEGNVLLLQKPRQPLLRIDGVQQRQACTNSRILRLRSFRLQRVANERTRDMRRTTKGLFRRHGYRGGFRRPLSLVLLQALSWRRLNRRYFLRWTSLSDKRRCCETRFLGGGT